MRTYIRAKLTGGVYFFTVNLAERHNNDLLISNIELLREAFRLTKQQRPFIIEACVILPEHLHCIWRLPEGDHDFSTRWRLIKTHFSKNIALHERISNSRKRKKERGIWQRRFWEHLIKDEEDYKNHLDYIHYNPVKHGYVQRAIDWRYSSFDLWLKREVYTSDWATKRDMDLG
ncbi:MAG: transposase [Methylococcaceae bacterium]|nr:transposase [Methylococcaceae bacterium]